MAPHIISPQQSWWEKLIAGIKACSPQVKQGLIAASVTLVIAILGCIGGVIGWLIVYSENAKLKGKVHDLELEVLPFRNLSVQKYNSASAESLRMLAESMTTLQKDYSNALTTVSVQQTQLVELRASLKATNWKTERAVAPEAEESLISLFAKLPKAKIGVKCYDTTSESKRFSEQLVRIFRKSGFEVTNYPPEGNLNMAMNAGQYMTVHSDKEQPQGALFIQTELSKIGIEMPGQFHPNIGSNEIEFVIMRISR